MPRRSLAMGFAADSVQPCRLGALLVLLILLTTLVPSVEGQRVRGTVLDDRTRAPVEGVEIVILSVDGNATLGIGERTDSAGQFDLLMHDTAPQMAIRARRIGYLATLTQPLDPPRTGHVVTLQILLGRSAVPLSPVLIVDRAHEVTPQLEGFERRRRLGLGSYITREEMERRRARSLAELLRDVPGVRVAGRGERQSLSMSRSVPSFSASCVPVIYLDGIRANRSTDSPEMLKQLLQGVPVSDIEAIEIYKGRSQLPAEFGGYEARCGLILVWTRVARG